MKIKKAFTLVELTVAVALLAMMISFSAVIFKISIGSNRLAAANAEIMQKFRAITDQLNSDFSSLCKDAPVFIWFELDPNTGARYDQIMFFAEGDFSSTQMYETDPPGTSGLPKVPTFTGSPVRGNVARIYCGQANLVDYSNWPAIASDSSGNPLNYTRYQTLARRCHILTADTTCLLFPDGGITNFAATFVPRSLISGYDCFHDFLEHDRLSLAEWMLLTQNQQANDRVIWTCFFYDPVAGGGRPAMNSQNVGSTIHMLLSEGVGSFKIQWAYWFDPDGPLPLGSLPPYLRWWPDIDPDGNGFFDDSDFGLNAMNLSYFGIYFNLPGGVGPGLGWGDTSVVEAAPILSPSVYIGLRPLFPTALKFTFTLYDSKGVIKNGRTFTHIVYLD